ncbi:MAG: hypothetical protein RB292_01655 [Patescibacteria group bacterium]|jgi:hypothetical protein|nr:hypothetical protein [Patescibacteria group bacterium]
MSNNLRKSDIFAKKSWLKGIGQPDVHKASLRLLQSADWSNSSQKKKPGVWGDDRLFIVVNLCANYDDSDYRH